MGESFGQEVPPTESLEKVPGKESFEDREKRMAEMRRAMDEKLDRLAARKSPTEGEEEEIVEALAALGAEVRRMSRALRSEVSE